MGKYIYLIYYKSYITPDCLSVPLRSICSSLQLNSIPTVLYIDNRFSVHKVVRHETKYMSGVEGR